METVRMVDDLRARMGAWRRRDERVALVPTMGALHEGAAAGPERAVAAEALRAAGFDSVDYVECREAETLAPVERLDPARPARVFGAARIGRARLIDNLPVEPQR